MTNYRRNRAPGGTYFFTINLLNPQNRLLTDHVDLLRACVRHVRRARPFHIDAWVVLPNHMHTLWTLPDEDTDYSTRIRLIKTHFSKGVDIRKPLSASRVDRRERGVWQRRFWEHTIRDNRDYAAHMDYIHFNPVRHGLAVCAADWPWSSFRRSVALGIYPVDWVPTAEPAIYPDDDHL